MIGAAIAGGAVSLLGYTYVGYPAAVALLARAAPGKPWQGEFSVWPRVSVCIPVHDGAKIIGPKLESVLAQDYAGEMEVLVYSDGSEDGSDHLVIAFEKRDPRVRLIRAKTRRGKPSALNTMRAQATGSILILTDARQPLSPNAVRELVRPLADETVGCVAGNLVMRGASGPGAYWKYEKWIRQQEARFRGLVGVSGALYAIRKEDVPELPADTILDDMWIPMHMRLDGRARRILFCAEAEAYDEAAGDDREFGRKVRTLAGNYQIFAGLPGLLRPRANPSWFETVSHKVARLACPWAMIALAAAPVLFPFDPIALALGAGQIVFYGLAAAGDRAGAPGRLARTFVVLNAAALVGLWKHVRGTQRVTW